MNLHVWLLTFALLLLSNRGICSEVTLDEWESFRTGKISFSLSKRTEPLRYFIVIQHPKQGLSMKWPDPETGPNVTRIQSSGVYDATTMQLLWPIPEAGFIDDFHLSADFSTWALKTQLPPERNGSSDVPALRLYREGELFATYTFDELLRKPHSREHFASWGTWLKASNYLEDDLQLVTHDRIITIFDRQIPLGGSERLIFDMRTGDLRIRKDSLFYSNAYLAGIGFLIVLVYVCVRALWHYQSRRRQLPDISLESAPGATGSHRE